MMRNETVVLCGKRNIFLKEYEVIAWLVCSFNHTCKYLGGISQLSLVVPSWESVAVLQLTPARGMDEDELRCDVRSEKID